MLFMKLPLFVIRIALQLYSEYESEVGIADLVNNVSRSCSLLAVNHSERWLCEFQNWWEFPLYARTCNAVQIGIWWRCYHCH